MQGFHSQKPQNVYVPPQYPSTTVNYMEFSDDQFKQRVALALNCLDMNRVTAIVENAGDINTAKKNFQNMEHQVAVRRQEGAIAIGRKPTTNDEVHVIYVGDNTAVRFWRSGMTGVYSLDFVQNDRRSRHKLKPTNIKLIERPFGDELFTIEQALDQARDSQGRRVCPPPTTLGDSRYDPEWETFLVPEGAIIDVVRQERNTITIKIPSRWPENFATADTYTLR
ncbi:hypothetical protein BDQ17DRAFT_1542276 [Cyathus striatus]|nr:hypothetical protein BDQ17DRAFT_1542276 [Cyathus striatus]